MADPTASVAGSVGGSTRHILILLTLYMALSLPSLWTRTLWSPDETRYALVAREMIQTGDYILPHLNGEIYSEKPPLFFWLVALASRAGSGDLAPRIISLLSGGGLIILTYLLGAGLFNPRTAFHASLILSTSLLFSALSQAGIIDTTFNLLILLAVFSYWKGLTREETAPAWHVLLYVSVGLAVLTKGPAGLIVPVLILVGHSAANRSLVKLLRGHLGWGAVVSLLIVGLWFFPAAARGGEDYFNTLLFKQNVGRAVNSWSNRQPFYYYLYNFPLYFLPWSFFLPGAIAFGVRGWRGRNNLHFVLLWLIVVFAFFSLVSGKRERYLFPLYPAAAILLARYLEGLELSIRSRRWAPLPAYAEFLFWLAVGASGLILGIAYPSIQASIGVGEEFERYASPIFFGTIRWYWPLFFGCVMAACGIGFFSARKRDVVGVRASTVVLVSLMMITFHFVLAPAIGENKSAKEVAIKIEAQVDEGDVLKVRESLYDPSLNYFAEIPRIGVVRSFSEIPREMSGGEDVLLLLSAKEYREILRRGGKPYNMIFSDTLLGEGVVLISNHGDGHGVEDAGSKGKGSK